MNKLWVALGLYAVLGLLAWQTLSDSKIRLVTLTLLFFLAFKTVLHSRREARERAGEVESKDFSS